MVDGCVIGRCLVVVCGMFCCMVVGVGVGVVGGFLSINLIIAETLKMSKIGRIVNIKTPGRDYLSINFHHNSIDLEYVKNRKIYYDTSK